MTTSETIPTGSHMKPEVRERIAHAARQYARCCAVIDRLDAERPEHVKPLGVWMALMTEWESAMRSATTRCYDAHTAWRHADGDPVIAAALVYATAAGQWYEYHHLMNDTRAPVRRAIRERFVAAHHRLIEVCREREAIEDAEAEGTEGAEEIRRTKLDTSNESTNQPINRSTRAAQRSAAPQSRTDQPASEVAGV